MSTCSTVLASSSALVFGLVMIRLGTAALATLAPLATGARQLDDYVGLDPRRRDRARGEAVHRGHRRVLDDGGVELAVPVEAGGHGDAVGAEHADLDVIAFAHV